MTTQGGNKCSCCLLIGCQEINKQTSKNSKKSTYLMPGRGLLDPYLGIGEPLRV